MTASPAPRAPRLRQAIIAALCVGMVALAAGLLRELQSGRRLGPPGLRLAPVALTNEVGEVVAQESIFLPERILDYDSILAPVTREEFDWLPRDTTYGRRRYIAPDGFAAQVSGVLMGRDRTSIHKPEYCLPGQGFEIRARSQLSIAMEKPTPYPLPVTRIDASREVRHPEGGVARVSAVYVYWFVSSSRLSNDHLERMWWLAADLVRTGELQRWAYMSVLGFCHPGQEDATYARLERLIQEITPEFQLTTGAPPPSPAPAALARSSP